jgi:tetratricopeptide (TPR) repeat protein
MKRDRDADTLLVAAVAFAVYVNNLGGEFVYDDRFIIETNPLVQNLDWWGLVTSSYWGDIVAAGLYRPLTLLSFGVNRALGPTAFGFHFVNNLLHAGASALVLVAARCLGATRFVALAAGLIFALHPIQTEAVDSIVGRSEILALLLALAAFVVFVRRPHGFWPLTSVAGLFFLALCSKESAAFALPMFVMYGVFFERRNLVPIAAAFVSYIGLRIAALGSFGIGGREIGFLDNPVAGAPLGARLTAAPMLLAEYAKRIVWPATLSADYSYDQIPVTPDLRVLAGLAIVAAAGALAWNKRGLVAFAALAVVVPLAGVLHVLFPLGTLFAERLTYLPMFGAGLLAALALEALPRRSWILGAVLALSAVRVVSRNPDWRDNETLFRRTVETSPRSARSHFLLGAELLALERYREAATSFEAGLAIAPQHVGARMSLGEALLEADDPSGALAAFDRAYATTPSEEIRARAVTAALAAGRSSARERDWASARDSFERARQLDPRNVDATNSLGLIAERRGDADAALRLYRESLETDPEFTPAILNLASLQMSVGELLEAESLFRKAVSLAPESYEAYNGLGIALARRGLEDEAEAAFRSALELDPSLEAARDNLRALGKTP